MFSKRRPEGRRSAFNGTFIKLRCIRVRMVRRGFGLRVLVISHYWAPENGVPQRRWSWLTEVLLQAGHTVAVVAPPAHYDRQISFAEWLRTSSYKTKAEAKADGQPFAIIRTGFVPVGKSITERILNQAAVAAAALITIVRCPGPLKQQRPDLVIGTVPALPIAVVAYLASKRFKVPYVLDLRDAWPDLIQESDRWNVSLGSKSLRERVLSKGPLQVLGALTSRAINFCLVRASGIIVTSKWLGIDLRGRHSRLRKNNKQVMGLVRNVFPPEVGEIRQCSTRSDTSSLNVLYAGTIGRAQNLANALDAAEIVSRAGYDIKLRLVGAGASKEELRRISQTKNVQININSKIEPKDLNEHYQWADTALVHLTDWKALHQAVPSKTYELMSIGKHISAVVAGETAELVEKLNAGHVVPPETPRALAELWMNLADNRQLLEVSGDGIEWVQREREIFAPAELLKVVERAESDFE